MFLRRADHQHPRTERPLMKRCTDTCAEVLVKHSRFYRVFRLKTCLSVSNTRIMRSDALRLLLFASARVLAMPSKYSFVGSFFLIGLQFFFVICVSFFFFEIIVAKSSSRELLRSFYCFVASSQQGSTFFANQRRRYSASIFDQPNNPFFTLK